MVCNCNCNSDDNTTIKIIRETTVDLLFNFNVSDLSSFNGVQFTIRKDYDTTPIINKKITGLEGSSVNVGLTPAETALFVDFPNGKTATQYIWGLDLLGNDGEVINIFPQTGQGAPLCVVYKHVPVEV